MFSQISKLTNKKLGLRFMSNFRNITYWSEKDNIYTIKVNPEYKKIVRDISINPKDYVRFDEELICLNIENYITNIHSQFDSRIVKRNYNILDDLKCQHLNSNLWIVKIEPVKFNNNYIFLNDEFINPDIHIQLNELVYFG